MRDLLRRLVKIIAAIALLVAVVQVARRLLSPSMPEQAPAPDWPPLAPTTDDAAPEATTSGPADSASDSAWVDPVDGTCPSTHPIKAKNSSKIFHVPEGGSYGRTNADRCYASAADAEADGYRQSKV